MTEAEKLREIRIAVEKEDLSKVVELSNQFDVEIKIVVFPKRNGVSIELKFI